MDPLALPQHVSFPDAPAKPCPACNSTQTASFYRLEGIPIHSCVLLDDPDLARTFPTGDLELAACVACGFVFNQLFDAARIDYSEDYEETQGYSGTFRTFLEQTIAALVEFKPSPGKLLLEIGCGRGDFLEQLCTAADAYGIGIDPSSTAGRVETSAGRGLRFLNEVYSEKHLALDATGVLCRHTLEHLPNVRDLVGLVFRHLNREGERWAFFEVPDSLRILNEGAFWDVYYEHCSYFSEASLGQLFVSQGMGVQSLHMVYAGQYLQILAAPSSTGGTFSEDPRSIVKAVKTFNRTCGESISRWHQLLQSHEPGTVALWGSGSKATGFLTTIGSHDRVDCVVDINPAKHGRFVAGTGHEIVAPGELKGRGIRTLIIMNPVYTEEITRDVLAMGLSPVILAV